MQVLNSLRSAKQRHPDCQIVKRKGRLYVICKSNPRFKAVQGRKNGVNSLVCESFPACGIAGRWHQNYRRPATGALRYLSVATRYR